MERVSPVSTDLVTGGSSVNTENVLMIALKEYEALRAEVMYHLEAETNLGSAAITLTAGILAGATFLQSDVAVLDYRLQIIGLAVISMLYTSLLWAGIDHDNDMAAIAQYVYESIRPRIARSLGVDVDTLDAMNWDLFHREVLSANSQAPKSRFSITQVPGTMLGSLLNASRYGLSLILSLACAIGAAALCYHDRTRLVLVAMTTTVPSGLVLDSMAVVAAATAILIILAIIPLTLGVQRRFSSISTSMSSKRQSAR